MMTVMVMMRMMLLMLMQGAAALLLLRLMMRMMAKGPTPQTHHYHRCHYWQQLQCSLSVRCAERFSSPQKTRVPVTLA